MKTLQQDLINGVKNPMCEKCWSYEELGETSMRMTSTNRKSPEQIQKEIQEKKLNHLVIDSGNVCNLACRTCSPWSSSSLIKEFQAKSQWLNKKNWFPFHIKKTNLDYLIAEDYSQIEQISVLGGEPFQNLDHLAVLETIISQGHADKCELNYSTNATVSIPNKILAVLNKFKLVNIMLSIDAIGRPFEYIRTNGVWDVVTTNVDNLLQISKKNPNFNIQAHPTISALNVLYLDELLQWYKNNQLEYSVVFCDGTPEYSFGIFNDQQKKLIVDQLVNSQFDLSSTVQHINSCKFEPADLAQFEQEIAFTKEYKGLDIKEYLPKLTRLLELS